MISWWYDDICFFQFFHIFIFGAVRRVNRKKIAQNKKIAILHLSCIISQEQYSIWSWVLVHLCKMMIFPGFSFMVLIFKIVIFPKVFFIFSKFWFSGLLGGKRTKSSPKWQEMMSVTLDISGNHTLYDCHLWYTSVKW